MRLPIAPRIVLLSLALSLAGCEGLQPIVETVEPLPQTIPSTTQGRLQLARNLWERSFRQAGNEREEMQLRAAELLLNQDSRAQAQYYLSQVIDARLNTPQLRARRDVDRGALAMLAGQPREALQILPAVETVPRSQGLRALEWKAQAHGSLGELKPSLDARMLLAANLSEPNALHANEDAIWSTLGHASASDIYQWAAETSDPNYRGWLALAYIDKSATGPDDRNARWQEWEQRYPNHPARTRLAALFGATPPPAVASAPSPLQPIQPTDGSATGQPYPQPGQVPGAAYTTPDQAASSSGPVLSGWPQPAQNPHRIGVLLPQSGSYSNVAQALLAGLFTAYYQDQGESQGIQLRVYDTGDQPGAIRSQYDRAVQEGSDFIVGPLAKEAVAELARTGPLPVPALSLNYLDDRTPGTPNLYQFGLLPEDEARQAAERAARDGHRSALVFYPAGEWGTRLSQAFSQRFAELGGSTAATTSYPSEAADFSTQIRAALQLDRSETREKQLQRLLGRDLKFQPSRRKDVDMIFVAATPRQARLLNPQFKFHFAEDLPLYATSHIYSGQEDAVADRDLNGIVYCDIPWVISPDSDTLALRTRLTQQYPDAARQFPRLAAMGVDAYRLASHLNQLAAQAGQHYEGVTGGLSLGSDGRVHRELRWAQFADGKPKLVGTQPALAPDSEQDQDQGPGSDEPAEDPNSVEQN